jgi:hypothetical protein
MSPSFPVCLRKKGMLPTQTFFARNLYTKANWVARIRQGKADMPPISRIVHSERSEHGSSGRPRPLLRVVSSASMALAKPKGADHVFLPNCAFKC